MDDLMKCLYTFVLETRLGNIAEDWEYQAVIDAVLRQETKLRESMDETQWQALNALLSEISAQTALEHERIFLAALELSRELNALGRS